MGSLCDGVAGVTRNLFSGYLLFRDFCLKHLEEAKPLVEFYEEVRPALLCLQRGVGVGLLSLTLWGAWHWHP